MLHTLALHVVDFLFPKSASVYDLECLTPADLLGSLPSAPHIADNTLAVFSYAEPRTRDLVWELKYRRNATIARTLALILYDILRQELSERAFVDNFTDPLLVPMPMSAKRLSERGWNQIEILCNELVKLDSEHLFEYAPHLLVKDRHTESQVRTLSKKARLTNVEFSMCVPDPRLVEGRNIILLDDVTTTGATLTEARRSLKDSGAHKILAVTIAH